jgi:MFS family permease
MSSFTLADHNHNLKLNLIHEFFWGFGMAFHTVYAVVPLFLRELGAPNGIAVSVGGIFYILMALPQLIAAILGRNIRKLKFAVIIVHSLVWIPIFLLGFTFTFVLPEGQHAWKLYLIIFSFYGLGLGIVIPIWADFLNAVTLRKARGTFFGGSFAAGSFGSFLGGVVLKNILESDVPFPQNFGWGFFIFCISTVIATVVYLGYRMNSSRKRRKHLSLNDFINLTKEIIKGHQNFQRYIISRIFYSAYFPAISLYPVFCKHKFDFEISEAGTFTVINVIASGMASYVAGKIGQRYGHKTGMIMSYSAHFLAAILALFSQNMMWVYGVFLCIGIANGAFMPSAMNLVYDFSGDKENKLYMALIDTLLAPFSVLFLLSISYLTELGYFIYALIGIGLSLFIGLVLLSFWVKDPRKSQAFVSEN